MKTTTLLLLAAGGYALYRYKKAHQLAAASATSSALTAALPTNPEAGDVTVVPLLVEPDDEVSSYHPTMTNAGSYRGTNWGSYRGGRSRRGHR